MKTESAMKANHYIKPELSATLERGYNNIKREIKAESPEAKRKKIIIHEVIDIKMLTPTKQKPLPVEEVGLSKQNKQSKWICCVLLKLRLDSS